MSTTTPKPLMSHIKPLSSSNYARWKLEVSTALQSVELWDHCDGSKKRPVPTASDPKVDEIKKWDKEDAMARSCIIPLLDDRQINHVSNLSTAQEIWQKLKKVHDDTSALNKDQTLTRFFSYKINDDQSPVEGLEEIEKLANALRSLGSPQDSASIIARVLTALPSKYQSFKLAWDSVGKAEQTLENLHVRLQKMEKMETGEQECSSDSNNPSNVAFFAGKEQHRHEGKGKKNQGGKNNKASNKKKGACFYCKKDGHHIQECRSRIRDKAAGEGKATGGGNNKNQQQQKKGQNNQKARGNDNDEGPNACQAFMGHVQPILPSLHPSDIWICDSGATSQFTGRRDWFIQYQELANPIPVRQADGNNTKAVGKGVVLIDAWMDETWTPIPLTNVLYIPGGSNLFSEAVMDGKGYKIVKQSGTVNFYKDGKLGPQAKLARGVYIMGFRPLVEEEVAYSASLWHQRLAHVNPAFIKKSVTTGAVEGLRLEDLKDDGWKCANCPLAKATKLPFPAQPTRAAKKGELIHIDLSGRMPTKSLGGKEYFMLIKDDKTGFRHVSFLEKKSDAAENIINFLRFFKNQTGENIKRIKTDGGGEFMGEELQQFLREEGIIH
ncbi:Copia protein [Folsomia candida]|uniref:Copia protein n=1 Tax=Folsomia candida TaxID=158441 RepID=A0A226DK45_FOLCA|nr:Copia protein [Folsomia candida]